jgi:hypothetical protein
MSTRQAMWMCAVVGVIGMCTSKDTIGYLMSALYLALAAIMSGAFDRRKNPPPTNRKSRPVDQPPGNAGELPLPSDQGIGR